MSQTNTPTLTLATREALLPLAAQFVETAAAVFGQGRPECLKLRLATEEIFAHLCDRAGGDDTLEIQCADGVYYTRVTFRVSGQDLDLKGLNITSGITAGAEDHLDDVGLAIAARSVDRLDLFAEQRGSMRLVMDKEKDYPRAPEGLPARVEPTGETTIEVPGPEDLKRFALQTARDLSGWATPSFFAFPGKVVDMVAGGEYRSLVAVTANRAIAGGMLFSFPTERTVAVVGPYTFHATQHDAVADRLLEACLVRVARGTAIGMVNATGLPESLWDQFDTLGYRSYYRPDGEPVRIPVHYRMLHEDPGCVVWSHPGLAAYLEEEYRRLVLAREVRTPLDMGETRSAASVFSAQIRRERAEVTLRPLLPGADLAANLDKHLALLEAERLVNVFFELDLGVPWHAALIPVLLAQRFEPSLILPLGGRADLLLFQHHAA